jgi:hypothetical protein
VHFFLRGLDEMVVALNGTPDQIFPKLYLSLHDAKEGEGGTRHNDSFLRVLTCRNCGQHFFERHYWDLDFAYGSANRTRSFENGDAVVDGQGNDNAVWSTAPADAGTRLLLSNRLLEDAGDSFTNQSANHRKDDPYIQLGLLSLYDFHPSGVPGALASGPSI